MGTDGHLDAAWPWHEPTVHDRLGQLHEFFVTATVSATFLGTIGLELWPIIAGLILGGALAAPIAAYAAYKMPDQPLMILVGSVIVLLSIRGLVQVMT
jgi:uncharacterized protein